MFRNVLKVCAFAALPLGFGSEALAQNFTTAAEVKPILGATKPQWIAVREYDGKDLLYFTNLLAWRCGVDKIQFGLNGAAAVTEFVAETCHEDEAQPNALKMDQGQEIYLSLPLKSVETVTVVVTYDDGTTETGEYARKAMLIP